MTLLLNLLAVIAGLALLLFGGEALVRGAVVLAKRLGVPTLIVGLTVVAFGTSTPELVVNLIAAVRGQSDVGFGNVVGSNIANIALLLGVTALIRPIIVQNVVVRREVPMMLLTSIAALILAEDALLNDRPSAFNRDDGLILLLLFGIYIYYLIGDALRHRSAALTGEDIVAAESAESMSSLPAALGLIVGGLVMLIVGGHFTVYGATELARAAGMPEVVIALTLVAIGTSLPELITCVAAARRNESDLAIGNLVGSNIYNITLVFGLTAAIDPISVPAGGITDILVMLAISALILPLSMTQSRVSRGAGAFLLVLYGGYVAWLILRPAA